MTVKRYGSVLFDAGLIEMACGDYVTYSDYQKLVAESAALRRIALSYHILTVPEREAPTEPEIDAAIAEIKAQGVDALVARRNAAAYVAMEYNDKSNFELLSGEAARAAMFADELRAGRKG